MTLSGAVAAVGSVVGRDHRRAYRNSQDGAALITTAEITAVVVTDGCSSGKSSEVGARLGARWIADLLTRTRSGDAETFARRVTQGLIERIEIVVRSLSSLSSSSSPSADVIGDMMLFGFLVAVVREEEGDAIVFGVGDGFAAVDGRVTVIDPGPENAPTYAAYALLGGLGGGDVAPRILHVSSATEIDTLVVGTDGAQDLVRVEEQHEGNPADISVDAFARDDRIFRNPSLLQKKLRMLSDRGLFFDDATLGIIRRGKTALG